MCGGVAGVGCGRVAGMVAVVVVGSGKMAPGNSKPERGGKGKKAGLENGVYGRQCYTAMHDASGCQRAQVWPLKSVPVPVVVSGGRSCKTGTSCCEGNIAGKKPAACDSREGGSSSVPLSPV